MNKKTPSNSGAAALTASASSVHSWRQTYADYLALTKPRITRMVVITAGLGFALAVAPGSTPGSGAEAWTWGGLIGSLAGTAASCMAASVFNQAWEKNTDALMTRTADRPVAAGRVSVTHALWWGIAWALLGQGLLCSFGTPLASVLAGVTIALYVLVYTPMKRWSPWALWVGAIPGALPPVIGYAAATRSANASWSFAGYEIFGRVDAIAWVLFAVMFFWQVPHFLAIAWKYRKQYAAAGMKMLPVIDPSGRRAAAESVVGAVLLLASALWPVFVGDLGAVYAGVVVLTAGIFLWTAVRFMQEKSDARAMQMFFTSLAVLPVLLLAVAVASW